MKRKYLLLIMILLVFFFLFFATSFALIPGDFGSAGGGPPDGVIDFEDLMIFAMAYGSTPSDANWNPLCDIYPDDKIDFEDLMIFAMNYGECDLVENVIAITVIYNADSRWIYVHWSTYNEASGYKIYRKVNEGNFTEVFDGYPPPNSNWPNWQGHGWYDYDVQDGNTYSYYVIAYGSGWETEPSDISTRYSWLPPCSLISPADQSIITDPAPAFTWNPVGLETSAFPYGDIAYGKTNIRVWDETADDEEVWWCSFDGMTTSSATYNCNGSAVPLVPGHSYRWQTLGHGYNEENQMIASSDSEWYEFIYIGNLVPNVRYCAITCSSGEHQIEIGWGHYPEATNYHIYKSINSGGYTEIFGYYEENEDGHWFIDNDVIDENTYKYYITADTPTGETAPSYTDTIDTWLPPCSLSSPTDEAIVTTSEPTFNWNTIGLDTSDFPYDSIFYAESHLRVRDENSGNERVWNIDLDDCTTSTVNYNQDGQAIPLVIGHRYNWYYYCSGHSEEGEYIAESISENWKFIYTGGASAVISEVNAYTQVENNLAQSSGAIEYLVKTNLIPFFYQLNADEISRRKGVSRGINILWTAYLEESNCGYKVYKSTNGGIFTEVFSQLAPSGYDWYSWWDENVQEGNIYSYYVTAYGDAWETEPSETVSRSTWLPISYLELPIEGATINDPEPTFTWSPVGIADYPYEGTIYSGHTILRVYEDPVFNEDIWSTDSEDLTTSTFIYNQDGQAPSLISGEYYEWNVIGHGVDQEGNLAAVSVAGNWGFTYIDN